MFVSHTFKLRRTAATERGRGTAVKYLYRFGILYSGCVYVCVWATVLLIPPGSRGGAGVKWWERGGQQ